MCGIAGLIASGVPNLPSGADDAVLLALARRGPDSARVWAEGPCRLFHRRLRILDVRERSDQPMELRQDGRRLFMVYNGEMYNFRELREELNRQGATFATTSDSEVLLRGFHVWGDDVFRRARGMWALAFWDPDALELTLVRDPLGKKPLYYSKTPDGLAFASNIPAMLHLVSRTPEIDPDALDCYLAHLSIPQEHEVFRGIAKVPPGSIVRWKRGEVQIQRYWQSPDRPSAGARLDLDHIEALLRQAVRRRLVSDVPLGLFLSAGIDSGLVAALAAQESSAPLVAVTAGTTGSGYDEREAAGRVASRYGLTYRPIEVPPLSAGALPALLGELGEPFGDSSLLPSYDVARAARAELTVALTGDGGDEAFFGYPTFRAVHFAAGYRRITASWLRTQLSRSTRHHVSRVTAQKLGAFLEYGSKPLESSFRNRMGFSVDQRKRLLRAGSSPNGHDAEHIYAKPLGRWRDLPDADALRRTFYETFLPDDYLTKVDTATMAASLEARCPFLDVDFVEHILGLPRRELFPRGENKAVLRRIAAKYLPDEIMERPKSGFGVPVATWLRTSLGPAMEEFVFRENGVLPELLDLREARTYMNAHLRGADHGTRLWGLLALGVWAAIFVDRRFRATEVLPMALSAP
jgi:asparagine synthase (glutamine-hydrolysing)